MLRHLACALLVVYLSSPSPAGADDATSRPNILFAFADDWGRYAGAYGELEPGGINDLVSTPHFDRIAREGVLLTNAFVNAPSCTPCRSSLLSGQHFWRTGRGAILQGAVWDGSEPSYPLILQDAGYHTGHPGERPLWRGRDGLQQTREPVQSVLAVRQRSGRY